MAGNVIPSIAANAVSFDASSQYLSFYDFSTAPQQGGGWTAEAWINLNTVPVYGSPRTIIGAWPTNSAGLGWTAYITKSYAVQITKDIGNQTFLTLLTSTDGINTITTQAPFPYPFAASTWYHIAIVITGSNTLFFVNGCLIGQTSTVPYSLSPGGTTLPTTIGTTSTLGTFFNGYISNLRIVSIYVYNTNSVSWPIKSFDPPSNGVEISQSASGSGINAVLASSTMLLTCKSSTSYIDYSTYYPKTIDAVGFFPNIARNYTSCSSPFNGYNAVIPGVNSYLTVPSGGIASFGNANFSIELFYWPIT